MEREAPDPGRPPDHDVDDLEGGEAGVTSPEFSPDWRLTPPSEKRVIKRGPEVELPKAAPKETLKAPRPPRRKEEPRVRYGYRVEISKDMTRRREERASILTLTGAYFRKLLRVREREEDKMDRTAWVLAMGSGVIFFVLSFLPWFRVTWTLGTGEGVGGSTSLRFFDLGFIGYAVPVLAIFLTAIGTLAFLRRYPRFPPDAGVIIGLVSLVSLALLLLVLIGNVGILHGAGRRSGLGSDYLANMFITKSSRVAAYLGVICLIGALTSSLVRLAERKVAGKPEAP